MNGEKGNGKNSKLALLTTLAQHGNQWVQLGTLVLITISGFGNWLATEKTGESTNNKIDALREKAVQEIHEIYQALQRNGDEFRKNNADSEAARANSAEAIKHIKEALAIQDKALVNQKEILHNQNEQMANELRILKQIHSWQTNFRNPEP